MAGLPEAPPQRPQEGRDGEGPRVWHPLPDTSGGADLDRVSRDRFGKPTCRMHGAMNKVSPSPPGIWRCLHISGCRAGCQEVPLVPDSSE